MKKIESIPSKEEMTLNWIKGYIDAITEKESVNRKHLNTIKYKIVDTIGYDNRIINEKLDDLPF